MERVKIFILALWGDFIKVCCYLGIISPKYKLNIPSANKEKLIISLTSYGRRVKDVLPFTLISLFRQTMKPDIIILWLDFDNWNQENIPNSIKRLEKFGLSVCFCKDLKSYKKLIPTLEMYPNDIVITCDDDVYYKKDFVQRLVMEYKKDPTRVYAHRAHRVGRNQNGDIMPYNNWEDELSDVSGNDVFPTGVGGVLYKKDLLYSDICNEELFMKLAPKADDVWFFFMEYLKGTKIFALPDKGDIYYHLDIFYQSFHKGASLSSTNCLEDENDKQIQAVMNYYNIKSL